MSPDSDVKMTIRTDSDAARGMIHRVGCSRVRHLQTRFLWHQQALREGQFNVVRCGTKENPSDLGTKVVEREAMASCMSELAIFPAEHLAKCNCCGTDASDQCEQQCDYRWVLFNTSGKYDIQSGEHGWLGLHIRGECWGRRSCRGYDAGLACGHCVVWSGYGAESGCQCGVVWSGVVWRVRGWVVMPSSFVSVVVLSRPTPCWEGCCILLWAGSALSLSPFEVWCFPPNTQHTTHNNNHNNQHHTKNNKNTQQKHTKKTHDKKQNTITPTRTTQTNRKPYTHTNHTNQTHTNHSL